MLHLLQRGGKHDSGEVEVASSTNEVKVQPGGSFATGRSILKELAVVVTAGWDACARVLYCSSTRAV